MLVAILLAKNFLGSYPLASLSWGAFPVATRAAVVLERVEGIEPSWPAWKAGTLPLCYTRDKKSITF